MQLPQTFMALHSQQASHSVHSKGSQCTVHLAKRGARAKARSVCEMRCKKKHDHASSKGSLTNLYASSIAACCTQKAPKKEGGKASSGGSSAKTVDTSRKDFIYQMSKLSKSYGKGDGASTVLKKVNLAFYPGAKIGVLGSNGSGKSTLMKIMAGVETEFEGESRMSDWASVG
jgi:ABC-type glutathione transport system ATPase component